MVYLSTFGLSLFMVNVGKYSIHGAYGIYRGKKCGGGTNMFQET